MPEGRRLNPEDIAVPSKYRVEVFARGLAAPISLVFSDAGEMLLADAGMTDGNGKVLKYKSGSFQVIADGFSPPLTGIAARRGEIYVSHRGSITIVKPDGKKQDILTGLPSWGDHHNNQVEFGPDGKMYFGQGTATNSGVVGDDNRWVKKYPLFHDYPGTSVRLTGQNFVSPNVLTPAVTQNAVTGAFSPFGVSTRPGEMIKGMTAAAGSILRANPDGTQLELVAWGLRNPFRIKFDRANHLFASNHGMDERGSRPIANSPDEFHRIQPGAWYGWPDYSGGQPIAHPQFRPKGKPQPTFVLAQHPMHPLRPIANFTPHSATMGFDMNYDPDFAPAGEVFIAEFGRGSPDPADEKLAVDVGHRVSRINLRTGQVKNFAVNRSGYAASKTGGGGFERPIDVAFGPSGGMYVVDMGISYGFGNFRPGDGVIWLITKK